MMLPPRENFTFFGNQSAEERLSHDLRNGLQNAYIISGNYGIGKETLAFRFIRHFLAESRPADSLHMDVSSKMFHFVASGTSPNLIEFNAEKTSVEAVRNLIATISLKAEGRRVVLIQNADFMNKSVSNCLLKSIEEPPIGTIFIIIALNEKNILHTIRSRCFCIRLLPLSPKEMRPALTHFGLQTNLLEISYGSIGLAHKINEAGGIEFYESILNNLQSGTLTQNDFIINNFSIFKILFFKLFTKSILFNNGSHDELMNCELEFFRKQSKNFYPIYEQTVKFFSAIDKLLLDKESVICWLQESMKVRL